MHNPEFDHLRRRTSESTRPGPEVFKWWEGLPTAHRPVKLAKAFPRIVNKLAACWDNYVECDKYLSELMIDTKRFDRKGFPFDVAVELLALHDLRSRLVPHGVVQDAAGFSALQRSRKSYGETGSRAGLGTGELGLLPFSS